MYDIISLMFTNLLAKNIYEAIFIFTLAFNILFTIIGSFTLDNCVYGNQPTPVSINGGTAQCSQLATSLSFECYNNAEECCETCNPLNTGNPGMIPTPLSRIHAI